MTDVEQRPAFPRLTIGVSSCLLGQEVRFNGGHKRDAFVVNTLAGLVDYVLLSAEQIRA